MPVIIDIKNRERIMINANGQRVTKLRGGEVIPDISEEVVATPNLGESGETVEAGEGTSEVKEVEVRQDISLEDRMAKIENLLEKLIDKNV